MSSPNTFHGELSDGNPCVVRHLHIFVDGKKNSVRVYNGQYKTFIAFSFATVAVY